MPRDPEEIAVGGVGTVVGKVARCCLGGLVVAPVVRVAVVTRGEVVCSGFVVVVVATAAGFLPEVPGGV